MHLTEDKKFSKTKTNRQQENAQNRRLQTKKRMRKCFRILNFSEWDNPYHQAYFSMAQSLLLNTLRVASTSAQELTSSPYPTFVSSYSKPNVTPLTV